MAVDPEKVKELREKTGLPMMDCKRALEKTGGDVDTAVDELRKAGLKAQEKLAGRKATEGRIGSHVGSDGKVGVLAALRCETEPVGSNAEFQRFLGELVEVVGRQNPQDAAALGAAQMPSGKAVAAALTDLVNRIRENITLGRFARFEADAIVQYIHFDQKKGAMVALRGGAVTNPKVMEVGKDLGMHIVFRMPLSLSRAEIAAPLVAKEREILLAAARNDPKNAKKPEEILKKIVEGQVEKYIASKCLLEQPFVKDESISVTEYLKRSGAGVTLTGFAYVATDLD